MFKRAMRALRRHGFVGFCRLLTYNAGYYLRELVRPAQPDLSGRALDDTLGVETSQIREIGSLEIDSRNAAEAVRYQPSEVELVRRTIRDCLEGRTDSTFIDFGCGKGRVMLVASEFPFRRILGVEFSPELHEVAQRNVDASRGRLTGCKDLKVILGDAVDFELPDDPLVCYFYNPFGENVMRGVVRNIERSLEKKPRPVLVIYVEPMHKDVFAASSWTIVRQDPRQVTYRNRDVLRA